MKITNIETYYRCLNANEYLKLNGGFRIKNDGNIIFTGNFNTLQDEYCGDFAYYEKGENTNSSLNNMSLQNMVFAQKLLIDTILKIKSELSTFNQE